ncbi:hypothetical protein FJ946_19465 [Mesorhizobium sp. B2-4-7]|nr:hypothetical protein FJW11_26065 [Mesorhizobium sp. B3-1-1]TPJ39706.1 hypothetical protein FJ437_27895 [Mesorhizobium sp. B2-6-6]TPJ59126.1 hypothetical protein FJ443_23985 [Mesorhizobium sp. B2-6-1]TPJ66451.1 hypothetical protein FJ462_18160 [Mesorhizobium sp. B2-6-7]TPJ81677.1 hypothetical protein FJ422_20150 [Mesorhizobium sp. B2-6-3]TPJ95011.1 hypothetical protein FJ489_18670 [Mesorhizobium sp. B2-5-12]TPJ97691.1 hypothetical protein FJ491_17495 [Mesorhizobium sp. B2-5-10]TPK05984.1 h
MSLVEANAFAFSLATRRRRRYTHGRAADEYEGEVSQIVRDDRSTRAMIRTRCGRTSFPSWPQGSAKARSAVDVDPAATHRLGRKA